jgi:glycosyltransferase involved in cell wall biosynthesis
MYHGRLPEPGRKPGGVDVFVHRVAAALVDRGHDVTVLTYSADSMARPYEVRTLSPAMARSSRVVKTYLASWLFNTRDLSGFDVFHFHGDDWFYFRRTVPTVRTFHGSALLECLTATSWKRRTDQAVIFMLELLAGRLATARYGVGTDSRAIYRADGVLACGIDVPHDSSSPNAQPLIAFIGTWTGRKRGALLHEVFQRQVLPQVPDAQLVMVSDYCEPGQNVTWLAHPSDAEITQLLQSAWIFCLPSAYEGLGLPYLEAMACGAPVVATPNPGAADLLRPGSAGLVVEDALLGQSLVSLIRNPDLRQQLSHAGRARVADFSWERVGAQYEDAYADAIRRWRADGRRRASWPPSAPGADTSGHAR